MTSKNSVQEKTPIIAAKINEIFKQRNITMLPCCVCGERETFEIMPGYVVQSLSPNGSSHALGGNSLPLLAMVCHKCGNTQYLNALVLGLGNNVFLDEGEKDGASS